MRTFKEISLLDEEEIVELIWSSLSSRSGASKGRDPFRDDVSWTPSGKKKLLVSKCDTFVASTDAPRGMTPAQMARKAITACASDFAAKGVAPSHFLISVALPKKNANREFVKGLASGINAACGDYKVRLLAGDTSSAESDIVIDCSMFGFADSLVRRSGAKVGDQVGVTGRFGLEPSGLLLLVGEAVSSSQAFRRTAMESVMNPKACLALGLKISNDITSSIDSSDGLAISLYLLAESSAVNMRIDSLPIAEGVKEFAKENSISAEKLALFGGEEYEIVCTYPKESRKKLEKLGMITIGTVTSMAKSPSVYLGARKLERKGWIHFKSD